MLRNARQTKILEIIEEKEIETQEELCKELSDCQFNVTQATVSRDVRELGLMKIAGIEKRSRYVAAKKKEGKLPDRMRALFEAGVESVQSVGNIVITKTMTGYGANAGAVIDLLNCKEVVGSIAGDDTVFSVCNTPEEAIAFQEYLLRVAKG